MIRVTLPWPPSANRLWRYVKGRAIKSADYRAWQSKATADVFEQNRARANIPGPYHMEIQLDRPDNRRRDASNLIKPVEDLIVSSGIVEDDHLAKSVTVKWTDTGPVRGGAVHVWVWAA